ncbi:MAG: BON domain-containing protein [Balneolales bacterium]
MKTEEQIIRDVTKQLQWDARIDATDISVTTEGGNVELNGFIPSMRAKQAALDNASTVEGVNSVTDNLNVRFPEGKTVPGDKVIEANIKSNIGLNLESHKIKVSVQGGWVTLFGAVGSYWEKVEAVDQALFVDGVKGITNDIAVVPTQDLPDEIIGEDIAEALRRNSYVNSDDVDVVVENGKVTLQGVVPSQKARDVAYNMARYTPGVTEVDNNIELVREKETF